MDKLDKLIGQAKKVKRFVLGINYSKATMGELLEIINENTSDQRFNEIVAALNLRSKSGVSYG